MTALLKDIHPKLMNATSGAEKILSDAYRFSTPPPATDVPSSKELDRSMKEMDPKLRIGLPQLWAYKYSLQYHRGHKHAQLDACVCIGRPRAGKH
eukprot:2754157-Karenia_brevis.AAC.1